jgi:hypothetical protein
MLTFQQKKSPLRNPMPIEIRARTSDDVETSRGAILSCDPTSNANTISHRLATKVLNEPVHSFDHTFTEQSRARIHGEEVGGYVDLEWCFENNTKRWHTSRFLVTKTYNPPYDAVLGRSDAEIYGMLRSRNRR